ncbi:MAG: DUF1365 domain-containing protein [Alphaproteobacteria bacterium]
MIAEKSLLPQTGIYHCRVMHKRLVPFIHRFSYWVRGILVNIDEYEPLNKQSLWLGYNKAAPITINNRDHGPRDGSALRPWVEEQLEKAVIAGHPPVKAQHIFMFSFPRVWGYGFSPLSVFFCYDANHHISAIIYEVKNTFGEQHCYLAPINHPQLPLRHHTSKIFYVSPFWSVAGDYSFKMDLPASTWNLAISYRHEQTLRFIATLQATWHPLNNTELLKMAILSWPVGLKIMATIHWQGLKIWLKGSGFFHRPPLPTASTSFINKN